MCAGWVRVGIPKADAIKMDYALNRLGSDDDPFRVECMPEPAIVEVTCGISFAAHVKRCCELLGARQSSGNAKGPRMRLSEKGNICSRSLSSPRLKSLNLVHMIMLV